MVRLKTGALQIILVSASLFFAASCAKTAYTPSQPAFFSTDQTFSPDYGMSVIYGTSGFAQPENRPGVGQYVGWPAGIMVDPSSGAIDLAHSIRGARYNVGFINSYTHDTSYNQVILSGIAYPYGVAIMDQGDTLLTPWYNADASGAALTNLMAGGNNRFDEPSPEGVTAAAQHLIVDPATGNINLNQSLKAGLFGANPVNGATQQVTIYSSLNDQTGGAVVPTTVIFHYYNALSDVPASLLNSIQANTPPTPRVQTDGEAKPTPQPATPRPPHIVIVNTGRH
jgi:hypothetical protein